MSSDALEEAFLSNGFYSSSQTISLSSSVNHLENFRNTVSLPNSASSNSISAGLSNANESTNKSRDKLGPNMKTQRTSFMKASPSIKALESLLNEKSSSTSTNKGSNRFPELIEEEAELEEHLPLAPPVILASQFEPPQNISTLSVNNFEEDPNRASSYSVQTFQTAQSHDSLPDESPQEQARHTKSTSINTINTIDESGYSEMDETPVLSQPAVFHSMKTINKDFSPKIVHEIPHPIEEADDDAQSTKVSNQTTNQSSEHEATLIDTDDFKKTYIPVNVHPAGLMPPNFANKNTSKKSLKSMNSQNYPSPQFSDEFEPKSSTAAPAAPDTPKALPNTPKLQPSTPKVKSLVDAVTPSTSPGKIPQSKSTPIIATPKVEKSSRTSKELPSPKKASHSRSNSAFSFNFSSSPQKSETRPKRSSTLSTLEFPLKSKNKDESKSKETQSKIDARSDAKGAKKFSFKSLFKVKPKNDEPKKLKNKSASNPQLSSLKDNTKSSETGKASKPSMSRASSSSILNVFKKTKSSDNLTNLENLEQIPATDSQRPVKSSIATLENDLFYEGSPGQPPRAFKSNTNINFINEFEPRGEEPSYNPDYTYTRPTIQQVDDSADEDNHSNFPDEDADSINLFHNPPTKLSNPRFDQELTLIPPPSTLTLQTGPLAQSAFGSPFQVTYNSDSTPEPEAPESSKRLEAVSTGDRTYNPSSNRISTHSENSKHKDQLLGEALFPKSLNPQEIESIVSLERSRSMRSIKSANKRNSFINYDGSDENIIQGNLMPISNPNTSSITRSNSILKNSTSKKNLNLDSTELSMNSIDANILSESIVNSPPAPNNEELGDTEDNFTDLIEFTDFIDADDLDFSLSPEQVRASPEPRAQLEPPPVLDFNKSRTESAPDSVLVTPPNSQNGKYDREAGASASAQSEPSVRDFEDSTLLADNEASELSVLTPKFEVIPPANNILPTSPESMTRNVPETVESLHMDTSPIFESAFRTSQPDNFTGADDQGRLTFNNRPISMSFKGLSGPSFGGKLAKHDLRSSDSHQSFNISFGDDSSDIMSTDTGVGGGFGSDEEEEDEDDDNEEEYDSDAFEVENKENYCGASKSSKLKLSNSFNNLSANKGQINQSIIPPPSLTKPHNRIPLLSDSNNSSPRSFSSIISKIKKSADPPPTPRKYAVSAKEGVRFSSRIILYDTYNGDEYDRHPDTATCNQLTPLLAQQIKEELNLVKSEMEVHEDSRCYTHFF